MANKDKIYNESTMKINRITLKVIGVLKALTAVGYALIVIVLAATGKISETINELSNSVDLEGISPEIVFYVGFGILVFINAIHAFLCFRTLKPGAKASCIALIVVSVAAFIYAEYTRNGGGILSGNIDWSYVVSAIINLTALGCAFQTYRYNKALEK